MWILLDYLSKFGSRKFLMALLAEIVGITALFSTPATADLTQAVGVRVVSLIVIAVTAIMYVVMQGKIDNNKPSDPNAP